MKSSRVAGICVVLTLLAPAQERPAAAPASCDEPGVVAPAECDRHVGHAKSPPAHSRLRTRRRDAASRPPSRARWRRCRAFCRVAVTSKPTADSDIKIEVWLPAPAGTESFRPSATADGRALFRIPRWPSRMARALRDSQHRQRPHDAGRVVRRGTSREARRLRASIAARDGGQRQSDRRRVLWQTGDGLSLERLFHGRQPGADARVDVPEGLRCHHRRRAAGPAIARARRAPGAASIRPPHGGQLHSARKVSGDSQSGDGCVRCEGWRERRRHRESCRPAASIRRCCSARARTARRA